ncbi:MAG: protease inhibitor I42 family protein [Chitinophagaceae bacterium]|nr:protease inhibitor I42 family protein [Chitinophagaceae bacterium]
MKIIVLVLGACLLMHCSIQKKAITHVTLKEKEDSLSIKPNANFAVEIPVQSGTGYTWEFDALSVQSKLMGRNTASMPATEDSTAMVGGPVLEVFTFKAPAAFREETLTFTLRRPWEKNNTPADVRVLRLKRL